MLKVNSNDFPNSVSCHKENEHDQKASTSTYYSKLYKNFLSVFLRVVFVEEDVTQYIQQNTHKKTINNI
jgi:hypothetical protein